ncbi:hypothetical protein [Helicobacter trogontum]|uniref:hypothetical protein n=1 Tax=Helicobacter trogontum TaxID=50960 RepID=UPI002A90E52E|nr:hypothetical protein [Helicobacter trogontum]MDY5184725.1 hypothetical protein [Helicobacter trogontum]
MNRYDIMLRICLLFLFLLFLNGCDSNVGDSDETFKQNGAFNQDNLAYDSEAPNSNTTIVLKEIPKEVGDYTKLYNAYLQRQIKGKEGSIKEAKIIDKTFVKLRDIYKYDDNVMQILKSSSCILPDCSALKIKDVYFYPNMQIQEAFYTIIMDKKTEIFTYFDIIKDYDYVLKDMLTTSINLQAQYNKVTPFQTLKFTWNNTQSLEITLTPKEEICKPYIYTYRTTFIQDSNGVKVKPQEERLSAFSYPNDLVEFVAKSCVCAKFHGYIPNLTQAERKVARNILPLDQKFCDNLSEERKTLWDKYMHDSRAIKILQHEQKLYP